VSRLHAKEAALERLNKNRVELPRETSKLKMKLETEALMADTLLSLREIDFAYKDSAPVFKDFSLSLNRGDRLAILGPNGVGKSSLLKLIAGIQRPTQGEVRLHPRTKIGYFAQELDNLAVSSTILDSLLELPGMTQTEARTILGCFLFSREDVFKVIGDLSLGEKCRVAFLKLYFGKANLLVLDEPTNYLDIDTRERVEEALRVYPGGLVMVSHDRYLHTKVANRLVILEPAQTPKFFQGSYDEYFSKDRSRVLTRKEQAREDDLVLLTLRLNQLIQSGSKDTEAENEALMAEIVNLRVQIQELRDKEETTLL
jgi:ATPase subunit of ABC transporter with duplicated ATPase domains